ncbi:hypothetical protein [Streptomonospora salina]|uniref:Uncharacterized protein n=1 Tax=Streptomonospora salina TaxID=104205 RepID=A0A841E0B5_9ACTN|nr:hypothetical protein [Streptomonospora salina]MBB5997177.1 hypothetical protein [Streptomonospora salina]
MLKRLDLRGHRRHRAQRQAQDSEFQPDPGGALRRRGKDDQRVRARCPVAEEQIRHGHSVESEVFAVLGHGDVRNAGFGGGQGGADPHSTTPMIGHPGSGAVRPHAG